MGAVQRPRVSQWAVAVGGGRVWVRRGPAAAGGEACAQQGGSCPCGLDTRHVQGAGTYGGVFGALTPAAWGGGDMWRRAAAQPAGRPRQGLPASVCHAPCAHEERCGSAGGGGDRSPCSASRRVQLQQQQGAAARLAGAVGPCTRRQQYTSLCLEAPAQPVLAIVIGDALACRAGSTRSTMMTGQR